MRESYSRRFRITFPNEELPAGRELHTTPVYDRLTAHNAVWGASFGLEHPLWFQQPGEEPREDVTFRRSNAYRAVAFRYADAVTTCDNHSIYKTGSKEIAAQAGMSITFMAKPNDREGNSCHIHLSLAGEDGTAVLAGDGPHGLSKLGEHFLAGQLAALRELTLCYAPNINSYKRYVLGSFAPTAVRWGVDNRTCALRLVGHGHSLRGENRAPGGDVNPYLAVAAMIAAGLHGIDNELPLEPAYEGNAYLGTGPRVPPTLRDALELWSGSEIVSEAFGTDVQEHYANYARVELAAYEAAVTDWELRRCFERL